MQITKSSLKGEVEKHLELRNLTEVDTNTTLVGLALENYPDPRNYPVLYYSWTFELAILDTGRFSITNRLFIFPYAIRMAPFFLEILMETTLQCKL